MDRLGDRPHRTLSLGANVIRIDLDAHGGELSWIYVRKRTERRGRLGQSNRCAAVEQPKRLPGPVVHGHGRNDARRSELQYFDPDRVRKSAGSQRAKPGESVYLFRHGESYITRLRRGLGPEFAHESEG